MPETSIIAESTITCPDCGFTATETMPTDACQFFYDCKGCGRLLRPNRGDCCVFCAATIWMRTVLPHPRMFPRG